MPLPPQAASGSAATRAKIRLGFGCRVSEVAEAKPADLPNFRRRVKQRLGLGLWHSLQDASRAIAAKGPAQMVGVPV